MHTILKKSGETGHSYLVSDLKRKCFQLFVVKYDARWGLVMFGLACSSFLSSFRCKFILFFFVVVVS